MTKKKELLRDYNVGDATLKQAGDDLVGSARRDISEFGTRGVTATDLDNLEDELNDFADIPTDEELVGDIGIATEAKDAARDVMDTHMATIRTMAENKWGVNNAKFRAFSFGQMSQLSDDKLWRLAKRVHRVATEQLADLAAEGLTQTNLDDLAAATVAFDAAIDAKSDAEKERDNATEGRIIAGNEVFKKMQRISRIGKDIWYETSEAKYNDYVLENLLGTGGGSENELTFSGTVTDNVTGALIQGAALEADGEVVATTNAVGAFTKTFTITEVVNIQLTIKKTGYDDYVTPVQFSPGTDLTQNFTIPRKVLTTYQPTLNTGTHNIGNATAGITGLRITLIAGSAATVGFSNNGMTFTGNTETVNTMGVAVERSLAELGGGGMFVLVQNNDVNSVTVKVEILG